jgi:hypothetical protein
MDQDALTNDSEKLLLVAELEPAEHVLQEAQRSSSSESDMRLLFSRHNQVAIQEPIIQTISKQLDHDLVRSLNLRWADSPVFLTVSTTLGCLPDRDCKFTWLRAQFDLGRGIDDQTMRPIACKLFPETDQDEIKEIRSFEITNTMGVKLKDFESPSVSGAGKRSTEYSRYQYHLTAFGKLSSRPIWDIRATEVHPEIAGDLTLILIVALPSQKVFDAEISISAEVQFRSSLPKVPFLMKRSDLDAAKNVFKLEPRNKK